MNFAQQKQRTSGKKKNPQNEQEPKKKRDILKTIWMLAKVISELIEFLSNWF